MRYQRSSWTNYIIGINKLYYCIKVFIYSAEIISAPYGPLGHIFIKVLADSAESGGLGRRGRPWRWSPQWEWPRIWRSNEPWVYFHIDSSIMTRKSFETKKRKKGVKLFKKYRAKFLRFGYTLCILLCVFTFIKYILLF